MVEIPIIVSIIVVGIFGMCIGSFINVLIDRLPMEKTVLKGRSICDFCKKTLHWYELIPIVSFILQNGKCRNCKKKLTLQYPLVELIIGCGFAIFWYLWRDWPIYLILPSLTLFCVFFAIVMTDLKYFIIPDALVIVAIVSVLSIIFSKPLIAHILAGIGASAFFLFLWAITKGKGMGLGDVKLAFPIGLLHGPTQTVLAFYIAFLTGAFVGVILLLQGKKGLKSRIPFGPFMVVGSIAVLLFGTPILAWWKGLL